MKRKRCRLCGKTFRPDPRLKARQKVCSAVACQKQRKAFALRNWRKRNPDSLAARKLKTTAWAKAYPDYWKRYRAEHPDYRRRERQRMRKKRRRARCVAKERQIRRIVVENLMQVQDTMKKTVANEIPMHRAFLTLVETLLFRERSQMKARWRNQGRE